MAIGAARCFGIQFPANFNSPYKSGSMIEFWRRWHMTLSRFLRDYLYIPLGGNRRGSIRRYVNLMITMLLGGLWHGANWTFVAWGGLHGFYLIVNHGGRRSGPPSAERRGGLRSIIGRAFGFVLTFFAVVVAWAFFRATSFAAALDLLRGMAGLHGISLPEGLAFALRPVAPALHALGVSFAQESGAQMIRPGAGSSLCLGSRGCCRTARNFSPDTEPVIEMNYPAATPSHGSWLRASRRAGRYSPVRLAFWA